MLDKFYNSLYEFYRSDAWENLMQIIRLQRVDDSGQTICGHCGKPIIKKYDCIGHHIIELTEDNVNDAYISLNPDNIMLVHHKCHNRIHRKLCIDSREVYLVYGSPLSGKSTFIKDNAEIGDLIIDIDNIWECVSGCERYVKPNRLRSIVFNIRDELLDMVKIRAGKWQNAYICGGYPLIGERERICKTLGAREIFIDTPQAECLARLETDSSGRDKTEWEKYINNWWRDFNINSD